MTTDVHQLLLEEITVARHLITGITVRIGLEKHLRHLALVDKGHPTTGREVIGVVAQDSLYETVRVPHALTSVTSIVGIDRLDRVPVCIGEVCHHVLWQIVHLITDITGRHDKINFLRQFAVEDSRLLGSSTHVIAAEAVASLETS